MPRLICAHHWFAARAGGNGDGPVGHRCVLEPGHAGPHECACHSQTVNTGEVHDANFMAVLLDEEDLDIMMLDALFRGIFRD